MRYEDAMKRTGLALLWLSLFVPLFVSAQIDPVRRDLIQLGYEPGPALGRALDGLLKEVVETPALNRRETLLARAEELLRT